MDAPVYEKSMGFAVRIVKLCQLLTETQREFVLSKQLLRSGTSIGANLREARLAESRRDFASKCSVALKEASETQYWLELLFQTNYLRENEYRSMIGDGNELVSLLVATVKTTKQTQSSF